MSKESDSKFDADSTVPSKEAIVFPSLFSVDEISDNRFDEPPEKDFTSLFDLHRERLVRLSISADGSRPDKDSDLRLVREHMPHLFPGLSRAMDYGVQAAHIDKLLVDLRGDRSGFPPEVFSALLRLRN